MTKVLSSEDNNSEDDAEDSGNGEEEEDITPDRRNAGRSTIESSFHKHERTLDMEYAESDSDLGADKERSTYPAHDDHNIPKEDNNHDEEAMDDNESTPKWELNLPERAQHLSRKQGGKTGFFFVYSNSLSPWRILDSEKEDGDGHKQIRWRLFPDQKYGGIWVRSLRLWKGLHPESLKSRKPKWWTRN